MKNLNILFTTFLFFSISFLIPVCDSNEKEKIAVVDNDAIYLQNFKIEYQTFLSKIFQKDNLLNRYAYLNNLIDEKLILKYAKKNRLDEDSLFTEKEKKIYNQVLLNHYFDEEINQDFSISDTETRNFFRWQNTTARIRHLFSRSEESILQIKKSLDSGEDWARLAKKCFQDSVLQINGGDIGWNNFGDLDPVFAYHAFSLVPGETSNPVRTENGYSIIQMIDVEYDGMIAEQDYQMRKKKIIPMVRNLKEKQKLLEHTDNAIVDLGIYFYDDILYELYNFLSLVNTKRTEIFYQKDLVGFSDITWDVSYALEKLSNLSDDQLKRIQSPFDLKQSIIGLVCREKFLSAAKNDHIHNTDNFLDTVEKEKKNALIKFVLDKLEQNDSDVFNSNKNDMRDRYFQFRTTLLSSSNVRVDSLMVKTFIM